MQCLLLRFSIPFSNSKLMQQRQQTRFETMEWVSSSSVNASILNSFSFGCFNARFRERMNWNSSVSFEMGACIKCAHFEWLLIYGMLGIEAKSKCPIKIECMQIVCVVLHVSWKKVAHNLHSVFIYIEAVSNSGYDCAQIASMLNCMHLGSSHHTNIDENKTYTPHNCSALFVPVMNGKCDSMT